MTKAEQQTLVSNARTEMEYRAADMQQRILSGDQIPLDELRAFILFANEDCKEKRTERNKAAPTDDVDFF